MCEKKKKNGNCQLREIGEENGRKELRICNFREGNEGFARPRKNVYYRERRVTSETDGIWVRDGDGSGGEKNKGDSQEYGAPVNLLDSSPRNTWGYLQEQSSGPQRQTSSMKPS